MRKVYDIILKYVCFRSLFIILLNNKIAHITYTIQELFQR
jgi:hypothetical protein